MKLSPQKQIDLIRELIDKECKDRNINLEVIYVGTKTNFFINQVLKNKTFKLKPIKIYKEFLHIKGVGGFNIAANCVIFTKNYVVTLDKSVEFTKSVFAALHELTHVEQYMKTNHSLHKKFVYEMEDLLIYYDKELYEKYHDDFFIEMEADHRAYEESKKYIDENKYIIDTPDNKKYIQQYSDHYKEGYDFEFFLKKFEKLILKNPKVLEDNPTLKKFIKKMEHQLN